MIRIFGFRFHRRHARLFLCLSLWAVPVCSMLTGCAYNAGFGHRALPGGYSLIAVPVFRNLTHEAGTEVYFTNAMVRELERSKAAKVTAKSDAQATLEGVVERISYIAGQQSDWQSVPIPENTVLTVTYRVQVVTRLTLRRNSDQTVLWTNSFETERTYNTPLIGRDAPSSANALYNHSARYQTIAGIAQDLMAEAHDRLTESFW